MTSLDPTYRRFGRLPTGEPIEVWTLSGCNGLTLKAMTFGAIITRLLLPDGTDVVLGFDELAPYVAGHPYFGAMVGRVAGRLTGAGFRLEGRDYRLEATEGSNTLHGGRVGFDKRVWHATSIVRKDGSSVRFTLRSVDGEQGFPGEMDVTVDYTVTADNTLLIDSFATTSKPSPISLTNHSYFNLAGRGCAEDLLDHELQLNCDSIVAVDESFTLQDREEAVNAANDLRQARRLREAVPQFRAQHGEMYCTGARASVRPVATLRHPKSGWVMECSTDAPYLQVYTGSHIAGPIPGKEGAVYDRFAGLCLECQNYPNAANAPKLDACGILFPGATHTTRTAYRFSRETRRGNDGSNG
jgi:aldose 1-epimerase